MRLLEVDGTGFAFHELQTASFPSAVPAGRTMIDVTSTPSAVVGCTVSGIPPGTTVLLDTVGLTVTPPPAPKKRVTKLDLLRLLIDSEWAAIKVAGVTDGQIGYSVDVLSAGISIDATDTLLTQLLDRAVTHGALAASRRDAILAALTG